MSSKKAAAKKRKEQKTRPEQEPGPDELLAAARFGDLGAVERLVDSGMDVNARDGASTPSAVRQPLMMAVGGDKHKTVLQMLLKAQADAGTVQMLLKAQTDAGGGSETSFHRACYDRLDCAKALVRAGCDTESGKTVRGFAWLSALGAATSARANVIPVNLMRTILRSIRQKLRVQGAHGVKRCTRRSGRSDSPRAARRRRPPRQPQARICQNNNVHQESYGEYLPCPPCSSLASTNPNTLDCHPPDVHDHSGR